ncbi:hypothetical protein QI30_19760 [Kurthia sp. 3B1D]|uniref:Uncharacterized protein n=1 Tax=Candidatus Kurthia intestinigallinarum TaxID=1562256 RepID=A0A433RNQ9_9BACL|nr:hypothetical protein [Kurthia sp. 3B1D]RUS49242.1 hypothetical protein QI30_20340 [Kurthia sp. 3B1D]RUS49245.1 hypothetical protein QI30_20325 [Kurthia sp. 3B1D]RUS49728.1 hypothetical protein QI30_19760 [Kurthia sp. 3B1D]
MSEKNERLGIKLNRESVIALKELKKIFYGDSEIPISDGFLIGEAFKKIEPVVNQIDWELLNDKKTSVPGITDNKDPQFESMRTTLAIDKTVFQKMKMLQENLIKETRGRVFFSFVVKSVLFAAILQHNNDLENFIKK